MVFLLGFLDFAVRQMVVGMFPLLKQGWSLDDKSLGALAAIVPIVVGMTVLPTALLIDRWSRVKAIVVMAVMWSLATIACGLAQNFGQLLVARGFVGLGEAAYGPAGFALLAYYFPQRMRATVIGGILVSATLGSVLGIVAGGAIGAAWGWQRTFLVAGMLSLAVSLLFLAVRDYPTVPVARNDRDRGQFAVIARALVMSPTAAFSYIAGASQLFVVSTLTVWLPSYFGRSHGMTASHAALTGGLAVLVGAVGTLAWARLADGLSLRDLRYRLYIPAAGSALTALLLLVAFSLLAPDTLQIIVIMVAACLMTSCYGPVNAVVIDVVQPGLRASATAMVSVFQNVLGLAAGPLIIGFVSDRQGLGAALALLPVFGCISAGCFIAASRSYRRERAQVLALSVSTGS
jgi:MFS family permease